MPNAPHTVLPADTQPLRCARRRDMQLPDQQVAHMQFAELTRRRVQIAGPGCPHERLSGSSWLPRGAGVGRGIFAGGCVLIRALASCSSHSSAPFAAQVQLTKSLATQGSQSRSSSFLASASSAKKTWTDVQNTHGPPSSVQAYCVDAHAHWQEIEQEIEKLARDVLQCDADEALRRLEAGELDDFAVRRSCACGVSC